MTLEVSEREIERGWEGEGEEGGGGGGERRERREGEEGGREGEGRLSVLPYNSPSEQGLS